MAVLHCFGQSLFLEPILLTETHYKTRLYASVSVARVSTQISLDSATQDRILKQF